MSSSAEKENNPNYRARRYVVELAHSWSNRFRKLPVRFEKLTARNEGLLHMSASVIAFRKADFIYEQNLNCYSFMFAVQGKYINCILQESGNAMFYPVDYPLSEPFHLYTGEAENKFCWAAFWGEIKGEWVKGIGAYLNISREERIVVVVTSAMASPEGATPEKLHLTRNQFLEMESFVGEWEPWLEAQAPKESVLCGPLNLLLTC